MGLLPYFFPNLSDGVADNDFDAVRSIPGNQPVKEPDWERQVNSGESAGCEHLARAREGEVPIDFSHGLVPPSLMLQL